MLLSDINENELEALSQKYPKNCGSMKCDITQPTDINALIAHTIKVYGRVDFFINSVGIIIPSRFDETSYEDIHKQINVNLIGAINCIKEIIPIMKEQEGGHIVTLSSLAGIVPETYSSIYTATKFALRGLNFTINIELHDQNIISSAIFPDSVDTPMLEYEARSGGSPLTFLDDPVPLEEVAKAVLKAILKKKVEICVPRSQGILSKFIMCFPKLVQRLWPKFEEKGEIKKQEFLKKLEEKGTQ